MNDIPVKIPFRIGTSSYIYPDNIIPNVRKLKKRVDDIELVLFEMPDESNIPSREELKELMRIAKESDLSYTVHMPLDINLGSITENKRMHSAIKVTELIDYLSILKPHAYIVHFNLRKLAEKNINLWQGRINDSLSHILKKTRIDSSKIAVENLDYPFSYAEDIIAHGNLSVCIDIGHLINTKNDAQEHLSKHLNRAKVIHLHGVNKKRDHTSLKYLDKRLIKSIWKLLNDNNYRGVLTLEVFSEGDFEESIAVLNKYN